MFAALRASFAFLTLLVPGKMSTNSCMKNSTFFYPVVGIALGLILACTSTLALRLSYSPALASTIYLIFSFFLTRGLHHDGLADIADAWGSGARGTKFREILKDSRIGSFGTIVLILYFFLCYTAITSILSTKFTHVFTDYPLQNFFALTSQIQADTIFLLFLAPVWGRIGLIVQPAFDMPYIPNLNQHETDTLENSNISNSNKNNADLENSKSPKNSLKSDKDKLNADQDNTILSSLSQNMVHRFQKTRFFLWLSIFVITSFFLIPSIRLIFILGTSFLIFLAFYLLSKREKGYNGDFLGAQCLCFEATVFLSIYF